jgi:cyclophilin family peptidyl-prolyl cis-trans isomerase
MRRMTKTALLATLPFLIATAPVPPPAALAPSEIVAAAPVADWVAIAPSDLVVMDLAADAKGRARRVVIQLIPAPFSQGWVGNIRTLIAARWYDGVSVNRVQDNYVVQWGDASEKKALPDPLDTVPESCYDNQDEMKCNPPIAPVASFSIVPVPRFYRTIINGTISQVRRPKPQPLYSSDPYGDAIFVGGWPFARLGTSSDKLAKNTPANFRIWPVHCYGMVGVGRGMSPDTGTGAELYTVIGHAPRHLDRNIALVGRVIEGIEHLSSLPRGTGPLGFYETEEERVPILSVRMGNEVTGLPRYQYLSTESASFAAYADARANRRDPFFIKPAGGADICNIPVPVRRVK